MFDFSISKSTCIQSLGNERIERMEEQEEESVREIQRSFKSQSAGRPRGKGDCKSRQGSMEWEAWKKKEKIKTRRSGGERERCTISFMSDPLKFHSTIGSNLRPVRLSLRSKPVVSNLFPPSFVLKSAFRTTINFHGAKSISGLFLSCERGEEKIRKKLKRREREKKGKTFLKYFAECWQMQRVKSVMLDFSLLESWLGIRAKISRQKWLNIVQRAPCLVTKQPVADSATIF